MTPLTQLKLTQFIANQKQTAASAARAVSSLNNDMSAALSHQAYACKDPDGVVDPELLALISSTTAALLGQYQQVDAKVQDLVSVLQGTMT